MSEPPRLGVSLEQDEGRLGLDFGVNGSGSSDQETDADSELPYARDDHSGITSSFSLKLLNVLSVLIIRRRPQ